MRELVLNTLYLHEFYLPH